ncbi:unnamed protein product [Cladocopium goreaui]|uniref:Uncharacterized protein n=1 Tax=Cladocopium goreaui TaxID=2562237 RepID=A0A9P1DS51_9DINO|nr:unnamed protein product [Cladocopium goreaui]
MARFQLDPYQLIDFQDVSSWSSSVSSGFSDGNYIYLYSGSTGTVLRVTWGIQNEEITLSGTVSGSLVE